MIEGDGARHVLGLWGVPRARVHEWLDRAESMIPIVDGAEPPRDSLRGRIVANLFFEDSTRTRVSFSIAARRLGADPVDLTGEGSSVKKGETLVDTALTVEAMGVDLLVVRTKEAGAPEQIARAVSIPVVNAGDGRHEHPTQGLLDLLTMRRNLGDLEGKRLAIVGDIANSRVARSAAFGLTTAGGDVVLVGPPELAPKGLERILEGTPEVEGRGRVTVERDLDEVLPAVDAVMMLRVQFERDAGSAIASIEEYRERFSLTPERAARLPEGGIVMHPGPMNRGLEIDSRVVDPGPGATWRSVILDQVRHGVAVRMAILEDLLNAGDGRAFG